MKSNPTTLKIIGWALLALSMLICVSAFNYETSITAIGVKPSELPGFSPDNQFIRHDVPSLMQRQMMGLFTGLFIGLSGFLAILAGYIIAAIYDHRSSGDEG